MSDIVCVTNRLLCRENFLTRIEKIAAARPAAIVLREKDLTQDEYKKLAADVMPLCAKSGVPCILHTFAEAALELGSASLHLPLPALRALSAQEKRRFSRLGTSCHCVEDAAEAEKLGCSYLIAGHIFDTDCKKGLPGRGLSFLRQICESVSIPVYAIGGISAENISGVRQTGASGACVMSGPMLCADVPDYFSQFEQNTD